MFHNSYKFNKKTLEFEKIDYTSTKRILQIAGSLTGAAAIVFATVIGILFGVFDFKSASMLKRENDMLKSQYEVLTQKLDNINHLVADLEQRDDKIYRFLLNTKPVPKAIRQAGYGGSAKYKNLEGSRYSSVLIETTKKLDILSKKVLVQSKSYKDVVRLAKENTRMMQHIPALQPVSLKQSHLTSPFGLRRHPIYKRKKMHTGLDFSAPRGTPIYAPGNGKVISTKYSSGYGREVLINHGYGYVTRYAHMHEIKVKIGQTVKRGQVIGSVGNTGLSTGAHLHYEIIKDGKKINPIAYFFPDITPEDFNKMKTKSNSTAR